MTKFESDVNLDQWSHSSEGELKALINERISMLLETYVIKNIEPYTDITYNPELARDIVALVDCSDLVRDGAKQSVVRERVQNLIRLYMTQVNRIKPIVVTNRCVKFGFHLEALGFTLGYTTDSSQPTRVPDGNVVVLTAASVMMVAVLLITLFRHNLKQRPSIA